MKESKINLISQEKKKKVIDEIIQFFKEERDEEIGIIAAEDVLNFFLDNLGNEIYNKGVEDSRKMLKEKLECLELDMEVLLKK